MTWSEKLDRMTEEVSRGRVFDLLPDETQERIRDLSDAEIREAASQVMTRPQPGDVSQSGRLLLNPCLTVQWLSIFEALDLPRDLRVFEPCSGGSEPVIYAAEIYTDGKGRYSTINLNRPLAREFRSKIRKVRMETVLIEEDATLAAEAFEPSGMDVACFHHAINDLLQTAVSEPRGMDTRTVDWWPNERQMIEWLAEEHREGKLGERAKPALLGAVKNAAEWTKPGGYLLFDHWTWEAHREMDWFPWELFCDLIPMARGWIQESGMPLEELTIDDLDSRWWMFLRNAKS